MLWLGWRFSYVGDFGWVGYLILLDNCLGWHGMV